MEQLDNEFRYLPIENELRTPGIRSDIGQNGLNTITTSQRFPIDPRRSRKSGFYPFNIDDGFAIAEEDLRLRGAGEVLGTRQSGMPEFRLADLGYHAELLETARNDAQLCLTRDPDLTSERGKALRALLCLFERDAAAKNLRSG